MTLLVAGKEIGRVSIVDDNPEARESYEYSVEDLNLEPVLEMGPLGTLTDFVLRTSERSDAAICDHHLRKQNYALFNGAEAVAAWYHRGFPALLCTKYETAEVEDIRKYMRWIPVMMKPDELDTESMQRGFQRCVEEFQGNFAASRRPWRTLIRVDDVVEDAAGTWFGVIVPAWDASEVVRVWLDQVPPHVQHVIRPDARLHAQVNLGASIPEELYFSDWEAR